ncbi:MAG: small basic protein [Candidatus Omnitrophica bacterium]|nr:small basic protein [Candidatus Omnitrophota bacterium]
MSIHPSLRGSDKNKKQRSVLKRTERLKVMAEKGDWKEEDDVFGLPKIKTIKIRIKKEKAAKEEATAEGAAAPAADAAKAQPAKEKSPAAGKAQEKK